MNESSPQQKIVMNKKILLSLFIFTVILFPVSSVSAQTTTRPRDALINRIASKSAEPTATNSADRVTAQTNARPQVASREASPAGRIASGSAALRAKLQTFRDKKKAATIERINEAISRINQRRSSQMLQHVDVMNGILSKAESKVVAIQGAGQDVSMVMGDIQTAKAELAKAKTAVEDQSKKTYDINIASESGAKAAVKSTRDLLEQDLKATHGLVKEARRVLINAITKLAQSLGEGGTANGTN